MNCLFSYVNDWHGKSKIASSENPRFPVNYLNNRLRSVVYRSASVASPVTIDVDIDSVGTNPKLVALFNYNFRNVANVVKFQSDDSSNYASLVDDVSLAWHAKSMVHVFEDLQRYQRIKIDDTGQPDTYHELGIAWVGDYREMNANYNFDSDEIYADTTEIVRSKKAGITFTDEGVRFRVHNLSFEAIETQDRNYLMEMWEYVGTAKPFVTVLDYLDVISGDKQRLTIYGKFASDLPFRRLHFVPYNVNIEIIEEAG